MQRAVVVEQLDRWVHAPAPAERLAALRILIGGYMTVYLVANVGEVRRLASQDASGFDPVGVARLLSDPVSSFVVWSWWTIALGTGVLFCLGFAYRFVGPAFAVAVFGWATYRSSWGQLLHFEHLVSIHLAILAFTPAADAWGVRSSRDERAASTRYGWPIRLLAIATVAAYFLSGIAKLRLSGVGWLQTETLGNHIAYSAVRIEQLGGPSPPLAEWVLARRWLITPMAVGTLIIELGAPIALASRRWRSLWVLAALLFHLATAATMLVFFGYRGLGIGLAPLLPSERLFARRRRRTIEPNSSRW